MLWLTVPLLLSQTASNQLLLESLDIASMTSGWNNPHKARSVDGHPLRIKGVPFSHGVGTHAQSDFLLRLDGNGQTFHTFVGLDDETLPNVGRASFNVYLDGKRAATSGPMKTGDAAKEMNVNLAGAKVMRLEVAELGQTDYAHADWSDATITIKDPSKAILAISAVHEPTMAIAHMDPDRTQLQGASVVGCTPGRDFIFRIASTGRRPLAYSVSGLPDTIRLESSTGVLRGVAPSAGTYNVRVRVSSPGGTDNRLLTIKSGEHMLALTPPMGWNSWNVWGTSVSAAKVRAAADAFQRTHLADYGYTFVNIDDAWEGPRLSSGEITTNQKFGDMAALASYVHSMGLKLGIYSSPGPTTCAGYPASYQHELQDAQSYANWGVDYLKYDWCSFGSQPHPEGLPGYELPYSTMRAALDAVPRDIVYSLCQYGMGDVYKWGHSDVGGNLWRTTGDINDSWSSMSRIGFSHSVRSPYVKPGGWNDPDMLVVGKLGWGDHPRPTHLTGNEQITHISLWSMLAAPLIIGCDLTQLDQFTSDLLMNPDVISIDQDPLGQAATMSYSDGDLQVWTRALAAGGYAVGLFNLGYEHAKISTQWARDLHVTGRLKIRDLWKRRDVGSSSKGFSSLVPAHGAVLIKVWR